MRPISSAQRGPAPSCIGGTPLIDVPPPHTSREYLPPHPLPPHSAF